MIEFTIAVDPGLNGGCAIFHKDRLVKTFSFPTRKVSDKKRALDLPKIKELLGEFVPPNSKVRFIFENVYAFPGQGVVSTASLAEAKGAVYGLIHGTYQVAEELAYRPSVWKAALGLGADKKAAITRASTLFGCSFPTSHEAEAALLGIVPQFVDGTSS